ncbi:MAG: PD-(D/E)XK nuclease family protein, partial [Kiritimatiellae bacterium]|nr:PD-(D/E)XK nuclease family protein [Kiritimatiellia bacterium]
MAVQRYFLGWDEPVVDKVSRFLLPERVAGPVDLSPNLIIVPTRQAGRRLREALALRCEEWGASVLGVLVEEPSILLRPAVRVTNEADPTIVRAVWAALLLSIDPAEYQACFPGRMVERNYSWALSIAELLERLRDSLVEGGYTIGEVVRGFGDELEEAGRWKDLARLEEQYLERLDRLGFKDPRCAQIELARCPVVPEGVRRVIVAAVPDPSPLVVKALESLSTRLEITVLVHAPPEVADCFDQWGRPLADKWGRRIIDIPEATRTILPAGGPADQSRRVLEEIAAAGEYGPADLAIGVPDRNVIPFLESELAAHGIPGFDPANRPIMEHALCNLVQTFCTLIQEESYRSLRLFIRHTDVLDWLEANLGCPADVLLGQLDRCQNRVIPLRVSDLEDGRRRIATASEPFKELGVALEFVRSHLDRVRREGFESGLRFFLQTLYSRRGLDIRRADDDEFRQVAEKVNDALTELAGPVITSLGPNLEQKLLLFLRRLRDLTYHRDRRTRLIDLEGWLELPWNNAPFMIVTGMNEGCVPGGPLSDVFLPDALRRRLGLRDDAQRFARDAYLLQTLIESRRTRGRIRLIVGRTGPQGEPLRPSRLFFRCGDEELVERVELLFSPLPAARLNPHFSFSFRLAPERPCEEGTVPLRPSQLSITQLTDYLQCPFRFLLRHILGMEELDDLKVAPDALDFGAIVHRVLRQMAVEKSLKGCTDERIIRTFLIERLEKEVEKTYGPTPSLSVTVVFEAARQRLLKAAQVQADLVAKGWETIGCEESLEASLGGIRIVGRVDRMDRNRRTGAIRIMDYKTSDEAKTPEEIHLGTVSTETPDYARLVVDGKEKRWKDLQLPLYRYLLGRNRVLPESREVELAFFNLPRDVEKTEV